MINNTKNAIDIALRNGVKADESLSVKENLQAVAYLNEALLSDPKNAVLLNKRGLIERPDNEQAAIFDFSAAAYADTDFGWPRINLAAIFVQDDDNLEKSIGWCNDALKTGEYAMAYMIRAVAYYNLNRTQNDNIQSINDFGKAIALYNEFSDAYMGRGLVYLDLKNYDLAISDFSEVINLLPTSATAYERRGFALYNTSRFAEAQADLKKALEIDPDNSAAQDEIDVIGRLQDGVSYLSDVTDDKFALLVPKEAPTVVARGGSGGMETETFFHGNLYCGAINENIGPCAKQ